MQRPLSRDDIRKLRTEVFFDFNQPGQLSPVFKVVLQPVNVYAPLGAYFQLYEALRRMIEDGFESGDGEAEGVKLYEELTDYFLSEECRRNYVPGSEDDYLWARVIIVLTMKVFAESGDGEIPEELLQAYLKTAGKKPAEPILTEIQHLYRVAEATPAGGAAFHFIASILLLSKTLSSCYVGEKKYQSLDDYLELAKRLDRDDLNYTTDGKFKHLSPGDDHCLAYLRDRWLDRAAPQLANGSRIAAYNFQYLNAEEKPGSWWWWRRGRAKQEERVEAAPPGERTVTAVMIGPSGSGKTTLVRELVRANHQAVELGVGLQILYGPSHEPSIKVLEKAPPPGTQQMLRLQGFLLPDESHVSQPRPAVRQVEVANKILFNIYDSKGGSMFADPPSLGGGPNPIIFGHDDQSESRSEGEKLYEVTAQADLLVLFISPEFLAESRQANAINWSTLEIYFANFIAQIARWNKNAMIAFAYTKCDEYGVRLGRIRRIVEDEAARAAMEAYRSAEEPKETSWQAFVSIASRRGVGGESLLVGDLLNRTGVLWKKTLRNSKHRFLNGYLVAAEPVVENLGNGAAEAAKNWESLGLLQIFADFFAHLKATKTI